MKTLKRILPILFLVFVVLLAAACKKNKIKNTDDLASAFEKTVEAYKNAENVQAKITLKSDTQEVIDVKYSISSGKITSLATVLTDSEGEVSVYVKDGTCYVARYSSPKEKYTATDAELTKIASAYTIDAYIKKATSIFNKEFFKASSIESSSDGVYKLACDLATLDVASDTPDDQIIEAEAQVEVLKALESISLTLTIKDDLVAKFEGTFVKDGKTSTITIEFISTSAFEVSVPNASDYSEKAN